MSRVNPAIAGLIDHTLLRPEATREDILKVCHEARQYSFASVCVNPYWVRLVAAELAGSPVKVCAVIGFPLGATSTLTGCAGQSGLCDKAAHWWLMNVKASVDYNTEALTYTDTITLTVTPSY